MKRLTERFLALFGLLTAELILAGVVFLGAFVLFFYLTRVVFVEHSATLDNFAFQEMDGIRAAEPNFTAWVKRVTFFASAPFLTVTGIVLPSILFWLKRRREALELFLAVLGSSILNQLLKNHFHRSRPETALFPQPGLSFPSGHAMIGVALYGCAAWLLWRHGRHPIWSGLLLIWAIVVGLSRVYLHVHYATDVLAGFAAGVVWLVLLRGALRLWWREKNQLPSSNE
ncbi:phosphatase PAP2 family protein [Hymenobacter sp. GOD-10R]|uniref:phosphatase PAP2 family protein n=1 Tax=Hymenobacter sp. GOD-10R TaxID=3093922 RepID=UPI002D767B76|nr:phosphatase PAP2 family protein [Hymenobacter sp. GOD-10R]WRQ27279.1 phosphatase PAP2 family protein [Hymenobacter sp. GOD-10R]